MPTEYLFDENEYSETISGGDVELEYWKQVAADYWISNLGTLYSFKKHKVLKPRKNNKDGHLYYNIYINGEAKTMSQHRLMAEAFCYGANDSLVVRHINDNPEDNTLDNLEWGTQKDNIHDAIRNGSFYHFSNDDREKAFSKTRKKLIAHEIGEGKQMFFNSISEAARHLGISQPAISWSLKEAKPAKGWIFELINGGHDE